MDDSARRAMGAKGRGRAKKPAGAVVCIEWNQKGGRVDSEALGFAREGKRKTAGVGRRKRSGSKNREAVIAWETGGAGSKARTFVSADREKSERTRTADLEDKRADRRRTAAS